MMNTAEDIKDLISRLDALMHIEDKTGVAGSRQTHLTEALRASIGLKDILPLKHGLERAYGLLALRNQVSHADPHG